MAFDFPTSPILGQKFTSGSNTYVWNGYGWMSEPPTDYVKVKGDTMTGSLTIRQPGTLGHLLLDNPVVTDVTAIGLKKNNLFRWSLNATAGPEPGAEVGTNFSIRRYNDAGALFPDTPFHINRKTGRAQIGFAPVDPMDVANKAFVEATMGGGGPEHVLRAGDVMTGPLTLPQLTVSAPAGGNADLYSQLAGSYRWLVRLTDNFELHRYSDAGAYLGSPLQANRATGNVSVTAQLSAGSMWTPTGYAGSFSSDSASIGNCTSGGTFSLNIVNCGPFSAGSITDYGTLTVSGHSALNGGSSTTTLQVSQEIQSTRPDGLVVLRGSPGVVRVSTQGGVVPDYGWICKPGVFALAQPNWFNIAHEGGVSTLWIDNTPQGQFAFVSDYRIKKDVTPLDSMWAKVKALNPISYTQAEYDPPTSAEVELWEDPNVVPKAERKPMFPADDIERWGFLAHELQGALIENAATGVKDDPKVIQSPNPWTIIAALTKTLQEAMERIEYLEARAGINT